MKKREIPSLKTGFHKTIQKHYGDHYSFTTLSEKAFPSSMVMRKLLLFAPFISLLVV